MDGTDHIAQSVMTNKAPAEHAHNMFLKGTFQNSDQQYLFYQNVLPLLQKLLKVPEKSRPCFTAKYIFKIFRLSLFKSTQRKQKKSSTYIFCSLLVLCNDEEGLSRHGICQIFYTSKIPNFVFSILPEKMRKSRHFWPKLENGGGSGLLRMDQNENVMDG